MPFVHDIGDRGDALSGINVSLTAVLGSSVMKISNLLKIGRGAIIELDRKTTAPVDLYVEDRLVARGEVVIVEDHLAVSINAVFKKGRLPTQL